MYLDDVWSIVHYNSEHISKFDIDATRLVQYKNNTYVHSYQFHAATRAIQTTWWPLSTDRPTIQLHPQSSMNMSNICPKITNSLSSACAECLSMDFEVPFNSFTSISDWIWGNWPFSRYFKKCTEPNIMRACIAEKIHWFVRNSSEWWRWPMKWGSTLRTPSLIGIPNMRENFANKPNIFLWFFNCFLFCFVFASVKPQTPSLFQQIMTLRADTESETSDLLASLIEEYLDCAFALESAEKL